jgi:hopanoid C-3 methylase HpnR
MKLLAVHPDRLTYSELFLCLEPLGIELVAQASRRAGHDVKIIDLQVESVRDYFRIIKTWQPDVVAFSCNYLANVPEILDLTKATKLNYPDCFIFVGGHSASFIARELLDHAEGAIDCVLKGEGEVGTPLLLAAIEHDRSSIGQVPGAITLDDEGPPPVYVQSLDEIFPARDLLRKRRKYFIGVIDPCASIEFSRGCPWDCSFCSAWTFYGRKYRLVSPEKAVEDLARIEEPGVFIVDDVAFIQPEHGMAIGEEILKRGIKKKYYLETRGDVLLRNREVFTFWKRLGLEYMFVGLEAIDEIGLKKYRKRTTLSKNFEALEFARSLGMQVAVNIIVDHDWDERRFEIVRQWCLESPEIVNISINTPYPGTESWITEAGRVTTRDYRLYDINHAVLPTRLPLLRFYEEFVKTQKIMKKSYMSWDVLKDIGKIMISNLMAGQVNFIKSIWRFNSIYDPARLLADHKQSTQYKISIPSEPIKEINRKELYILCDEGIKTDETN